MTELSLKTQIIELYQNFYPPRYIKERLNVSGSQIDFVLKQAKIPRWNYKKGGCLTEKRCSCCWELKKIEDFGLRNNRKHTDRDSECFPCAAARIKNYRDRNIEDVRKNQRDKAKEKRKNNPQYKIAQNLRRRVREVVKIQQTIKRGSQLEMLGCSSSELIEHLESKFLEGMTWENYGNKNGQWNIDHIKPCHLFDLTRLEEQKECFHYTNLRPLWAGDNFSKKFNLF